MKFWETDLGWIRNNDGEQKNIIANALCSDTIKTTLIGGGIIAAGVAYMIFNSFRNGALSGYNAEYNVMKDLNLLDPESGHLEKHDGYVND